MQLFAATSFAILILDSKAFLYMASLGAFVVGIGVGLGWENKKKRTTQRELRTGSHLLANTQFSLSTGATFGLPVAILFWIGIDHARKTYAWLPLQMEFIALALWVTLTSIWLGFCVGRQVPILTSFLKKTNAPNESYLFLFGSDFLGCFIGALLFLVWLYPFYGLVRTLAIASLVSAVGYFLTLLQLDDAPRKRFAVQVVYVTAAVWVILKGAWLENSLDNLLFGF